MNEEQQKQPKMTDKSFDVLMSHLVGEALTGGIHPTSVVGVLSRLAIEAHNWASRNTALAEQAKAQAMVKDAQEKLNGDGKVTRLSDVIMAGHAPAIIVKE